MNLTLLCFVIFAGVFRALALLLSLLTCAVSYRSRTAELLCPSKPSRKIFEIKKYIFRYRSVRGNIIRISAAAIGPYEMRDRCSKLYYFLVSLPFSGCSKQITVVFTDRMTVHRNKFLVNKTNRCTEFQFYWYYYSTCFGQPSAHHQELLAIHRLL